MHSKAAGELAGTFTWATNKFCLTLSSRQRMRYTAKRLEENEAWWREAFNSGFVEASQKLNAAATAIGEDKTCSLYISLYIEPLPSRNRCGVREVWMVAIRLAVT